MNTGADKFQIKGTHVFRKRFMKRPLCVYTPHDRRSCVRQDTRESWTIVTRFLLVSFVQFNRDFRVNLIQRVFSRNVHIRPSRLIKTILNSTFHSLIYVYARRLNQWKRLPVSIAFRTTVHSNNSGFFF